MEDELKALTEAVKDGDRGRVKECVSSLLEAGEGPKAILGAMVEAMDELGILFSRSQIFVPQMLIAARAMNDGLERLEPRLVAEGIRPEFTAVIGTVKGDLHDIGKNLVSMMWRGANFNVIDLGVSVPPEKFVEAAKENNAHLVGLSALITTTMPAMKQTIEQLRAAADLERTKIIVGGAPVTQDFADAVGADGYARDAGSAVAKAKQLVGAT